jgi:hypothetical protein
MAQQCSAAAFVGTIPSLMGTVDDATTDLPRAAVRDALRVCCAPPPVADLPRDRQRTARGNGGVTATSGSRHVNDELSLVARSSMLPDVKRLPRTQAKRAADDRD